MAVTETASSASKNQEPIRRTAQSHLAQAVMRRQGTLSVRVALIFLIPLFGLPLFNQFFPNIAAQRIVGFTLTWLFLGVLFYPLTWLLSAYFIRASDQIEAESVRTFRESSAAPDPENGAVILTVEETR